MVTILLLIQFITNYWYETFSDIFGQAPYIYGNLNLHCVQISPRQGLLRVREFTLAEIEHFVDPQDKSHPKFSEIAHLEFLMFPRDEQMSGQSEKKLQIGEAVSKVCFELSCFTCSCRC